MDDIRSDRSPRGILTEGPTDADSGAKGTEGAVKGGGIKEPEGGGGGGIGTDD